MVILETTSQKKLTLMDQLILENFLMTKEMEKVFTYIKTTTNILEIGKMIYLMELEFIYSKMEIFFMVN